MESKPTIIFRADGDAKIGLGHITRSSALAGMINENYNCILATRCQLETTLKELSSVYSKIIILPEEDYYKEATVFDKIGSAGDLVVLDGYNFDDNYQKQLFDKGFDIFSIDDIHAFKFYSKVIINHSGGLKPVVYSALPFTQFYLGPRFALLRQEFLRAAKTRRTSVTDKNCFICFGGADPGNKTLEILKDKNIINTFDHLFIVVGGAYLYKKELNEYVAQHQYLTVYHDISAAELVTVMQRCSYAICSPSTILYEYLSIGGVVFLEIIAENQKDANKFFTEEGMAFKLAHFGNIEKDDANKAFEKQSFFFDGRADERYRNLFCQYFEGKNLSIRKATEVDMLRCYEWANDPEVRNQSYHQNNIAFENHKQWFAGKLHDIGSFFYILELNDEPIAQIRFQLSGSDAVLGYLIGNSKRGRGFGTTVLSKGIETFIKECHQPVSIIGYVKKSNIASQRSFERLSFEKTNAAEFPESYKYTMKYEF